jgi:hypothetical protein
MSTLVVVEEMKMLTKIITSSQELSEVENDLEVFLHNNSDNPFMLPSFIKNAVQQATLSHDVPTILVSRLNNEIIGIAPLVLRQSFSIFNSKFYRAEFILDYPCAPDFVVKDEYRQMFIEEIVAIVFKKIRCRSANLHFSQGSPNLLMLKQICKKEKIGHIEKLEQNTGHGVLLITSSWIDYKNSRGRNFGRSLRRMEKNVNNLGTLKVSTVENSNDPKIEETTFRKILAIDKISWKAKHRELLGLIEDNSLNWLLKSSSSTKYSRYGFKRKVWFLEIDNKPVAYQVVLQFRKTAYFAKTSFAKKYWKFGIGKFIKSEAVRGLFEEKEVQKIDFMTNLPMVEFFGAVCRQRVNIVLGDPKMILVENMKLILEKVFASLTRRRRPSYFLPTARAQLAEASHCGKQQ